MNRLNISSLNDMKLVAIGGGTGLSTMLRGLKNLQLILQQ